MKEADGKNTKATVAVALSQMPDIPARLVSLALDIADLSERDQETVIALVEMLKAKKPGSPTVGIKKQ